MMNALLRTIIQSITVKSSLSYMYYSIACCMYYMYYSIACCTGCPKKTWEFSDEFNIFFFMNMSIVISDFKSHTIIMSARV